MNHIFSANMKPKKLSITNIYASSEDPVKQIFFSKHTVRYFGHYMDFQRKEECFREVAEVNTKRKTIEK